MNDQVTYLEIGKLHESPTNTRRTWGDLKAFAEGIGKVGILQPILARKNADGFEIVFGHRRFRAAKIAKLETVPVIIAELSDEAALEAQVKENAERVDLHPLEEAEGWEQLRSKFEWSAEDIAAAVGKSKAYVYARLKLLELCPEARKAFYDGGLTASTALYVARIPHADLQKEALKEISRWQRGDSEPMSARDCHNMIERRFLLQLSEAPFDKASADLVPKAGSCIACPKRTGNQKELFADVKSGDVCTDPKCWENKRVAAGKTKADALEAKGVKVVVGTPSANAPYGMGGIAPPSGYAPLTHYDYARGGRLDQVLKRAKIEPKPVVMFYGAGKEVKLVRLAEVPKSAPKASSSSTARYDQLDKTRRAKDKAEDRVVQACLKFVRGMKPEEAIRFFLLGQHNVIDAQQEKIRKFRTPELVTMLVEQTLEEDYDPLGKDEDSSLQALCKTFKVDWKGILEEELAKVAPKGKKK